MEIADSRRVQDVIDRLRLEGKTENADFLALLMSEETLWRYLGQKEYISIPEIADLMGISSSRIKSWEESGLVRMWKVGDTFFVSSAQLSEYVSRAGSSLDLEELSDSDVQELIQEDRGRNSESF